MQTLVIAMALALGAGLPAENPAAPAAEVGPSLGDEALPVPRPLPAGTPAAVPTAPEPAPLPVPVPEKVKPGPGAGPTWGTVSPAEEPAPAPRELGALVPPQPLPREEPAPLPHEQTPPPPRLVLPGAAGPSPLAEVQGLHQEIDKLRMEREALALEEMALLSTRENSAGSGDETARLRRRITELMTRAAQAHKQNSQPPAPPPAPASKGHQPPHPQPLSPGGGEGGKHPPPPPAGGRGAGGEGGEHPRSPEKPPAKPPDGSGKLLTEAPVDPVSLARSLFLAGDHAAALNAYRKLEADEPRAEDRIALQYMVACCLRRLGKLDEAAATFREVANSGGDEAVVENAQWQLRALRERRELEAQLEQLRQRRQAVTPRKP